MHKIMLKFFGFLKSLAQFLKIVTIFCSLCLILYWIEDLAGFNWSWLGFISPLLNTFLEFGKMISDRSYNFFGAIFEYKYAIALILFFTLYYVINILQIGLDYLEDLYGDGRRLFRKIQEDIYNKNLEIKNNKEQAQIKNYQIFVAAYAKQKASHLTPDINLEEEIKNMNKYLIQKTGISPIKYGEGFLYTFNDFSHIDNVLPSFFNLIHSKAPLDYIICVQILPKELKGEFENMKKLINLNLSNQITTLSDTVWRYKHNETHKYRTIQLGLYKKNNDTFEVYEFDEM